MHDEPNYWQTSVYPRWRGEHDFICPAESVKFGLSPLARGTRQAYCEYFSVCRFIPAAAGNTISGLCCGPLISVYPRWRGEHMGARVIAFSNCGLSPLARGTLSDSVTCATNRRFIPAGAGNTILLAYSIIPEPVYPRWRGEHVTRRTRKNGKYGLSPLARGTRSPNVTKPTHVRFIPAGAGNTHQGEGWRRYQAVYPRWRGEHGRRSQRHSSAHGLSPLARGTPKRGNKRAQHGRFIPAGAGNTTAGYYFFASSTVYPRWRGEH